MVAGLRIAGAFPGSHRAWLRSWHRWPLSSVSRPSSCLACASRMPPPTPACPGPASMSARTGSTSVDSQLQDPPQTGSPSDRLPPALAQIATLRAPLNGGSRPTSLGLTPDLAREVTLPGTGLRAWLIPGRHGLCWDAEYAGHELGAFCSSLQTRRRLSPLPTGRLGQDENRLLTIGLVTARPRARADETLRTANPSSIRDGFYAGYGISGKPTSPSPPAALRFFLAHPASSSSTPSGLPPPLGPHRLNEERFSPISLRSPAGGRAPEGIAQIYKSTHGDSLSLTLSGVRPIAAHSAARSGSTTPSTPRGYSASSLHTSGAPGH